MVRTVSGFERGEVVAASRVFRGWNVKCAKGFPQFSIIDQTVYKTNNRKLKTYKLQSYLHNPTTASHLLSLNTLLLIRIQVENTIIMNRLINQQTLAQYTASHSPPPTPQTHLLHHLSIRQEIIRRLAKRAGASFLRYCLVNVSTNDEFSCYLLIDNATILLGDSLSKSWPSG